MNNPVYIIIPAYNEGKNLKKLIPYLYNIKIKNLRSIIVVDSNSNDETFEVMNNFLKNYLNLVYIREELRNGKATAINKALKLINKGIVVIHSADCFTDENSINALIEAIHGDVAASMPQVEPIMKTGCLTEKISYFSWILSNETSKELFNKGNLKHLGGDIIAIRRDAISLIYSKIINDDAYLALLLSKKGYKIAFIEKAKSRIKTTSYLPEYIKQRLRINLGHKLNKKLLGEESTTLKSLFYSKPFLALKILLRILLRFFPSSFVYIPFLIILELFVNVYSSLKPSFHEFIKWPLAYSTKDLFMLNKDLITKNGSSRMEK